MSQVYFDAWAIGIDERWGRDRRLQQGLPYYRREPEDNQYAHPLDFIVIADTETEEILSVDIVTAANYDYGFYYTFTLDGTYKLEVRLTGILNTYCLHPSEMVNLYGMEVAYGVTAHNYQHIFSLRIDPEIDGKANPYGNGFFCRQRAVEGASLASLGRSWDIVNPTKVNPVCKKPVGYKILNSQYPGLLAQEGSIVRQRAAFATKPLWVVPFKDFRLYPAGNYVCQSTGEAHQSGNETLEGWVSDAKHADIVCYVQFGLTHIPRTEDFPIMPAEPVSVTLRAANFFQSSPALPFLTLPQNRDTNSQLAGLGQSACVSHTVTVREGSHVNPRLQRKLSL
ncbi:hypothetical protein KXW97_007935 [Aspergillus fumigatus]|nr:hypothetical protein KXW97_007935 [Aspergillus fumigatus]